MNVLEDRRIPRNHSWNGANSGRRNGWRDDCGVTDHCCSLTLLYPELRSVEFAEELNIAQAQEEETIELIPVLCRK